MAKPKIAFYWCASCGGCEEAVVDLAEKILPVVQAVDIVLWPVALDFKRQDIEQLADQEIAVAFINGAIRTSEQKEMVELLRRKAQLVVAFGACAHLGGIPGLANLSNREALLKTVYQDTPSVINPAGILPQELTEQDGCRLELPAIHNEVRALDQVITVDYYLPGCAPPPDLIQKAVEAILTGNLPPRGAILAPAKALCDTCPRRDTKPDKLNLKTIRRVATTDLPPEKCFLAEGLICLGPATRSGCGERCINAHMPCEGCFGPTEGIRDQGARFLTALASIIETEDEVEINRIMDSVQDPTGKFYMFSLAGGLRTRFLD